MNNRSRYVLSLSTLLLLLTSMMSAQLERLPYSGGVLVSRAIKDGRAPVRPGTGVGAMENSGTPFSLTCSPAPCIYTPVNASEGGTNPVNEDPIAVNPTNAKNLLTGGNDYNCANIQGYFATTDGGTTWSHFCSLGSGGQGDPIVGFDLTGKAFAGGIQNNDIVMASSTDGGKTFGTPVVVTPPIQKTNGLADKPWLEVDINASSPFKNALYVSSTQFGGSSGSNSVIAVSHSTDGGLTWSTTPVDTLQIYPGTVDQFSDLAIGSDGTVYVNWIRCPTTGAAGDCGGTLTQIMFSKSTNGGKTWSKAAVAATTTLTPDATSCCFYGSLPNTGERLSNVPANAALGSGATTKLYVAFYNWTGTQAQVEVVESTNGGTTWGTPVVINPTSTKGDQFLQWLNVNQKNGKVAVTWLDRRNDPANVSYQPFFAYSNTGATYSKGYALSKKLSNPNNDGFSGAFMGDYTGNAWDGLSVYMSYMDTTTGVAQDFVTGVLF